MISDVYQYSPVKKVPLVGLDYVPKEPLFLQELSPATLQRAIQEGVDQANAGQLIPNEQVKKHIARLIHEI